MNDTTNTTDHVDPLQNSAMVNEAMQVATGDAVAAQAEGTACENQALSYQDYVLQFCSPSAEDSSGSATALEQETETWEEDIGKSHAQLIAQTETAIKAAQAAVKAVAAKAKAKKKS